MSKVIYICSAGHSGSTLLDLLLGSHPDVTSLGEIAQLPKNIALNTTCTCGKPVRECGVWSRVIRDMSEYLGESIFDHPYALNLGYFKARVIVDRDHQGLRYELNRRLSLGLWYARLRYNLPVPNTFVSRIREGAKNSFVLYDKVSELLGTGHVVDSSKNYLRALSLYEHRPDDVKIILLTRDGRGVFYSGRKRGFSRSESLGAWKKYYSRAMPLLDRYIGKTNLMQLRYEDLVATPDETLMSLCQFIGVDYQGQILKPGCKVRHITNGNNMRFRELKIQQDFSWKKGLAEDDLKYFMVNAGALNRRLGYGCEQS